MRSATRAALFCALLLWLTPQAEATPIVCQNGESFEWDGTNWPCSNSVVPGGSAGTPSSIDLTHGINLPATAVAAGALANGMKATTQSAADNSTNIATTAYSDRAGGGAARGPIFPSSAFPGDTSGRLFASAYSGGGGNAAPVEFGMGVKASLDADAVWELRFPMPPAIPTGTMKLRCLHLANATSGNILYTVSDAAVAANGDPSSATLTAETQSTATFSAADTYLEVKTSLSATPTANEVLVLAITYNHTNWTLAQPLTAECSVIWE